MTEQVEAHVLRRYSLIKKVGSGAYGHVWKVTDRKSGETLALKKIFDAFQHSTDAQRTYRQIVFLHELNHPNIIKLYNVIRAQNDKDLYLVFEYMEADLHNAIGQKILKDAHNRYILYQLIKGLKFMHSAEVIHRDLKPSNLLLNSDCNLKICDYGLARSLDAESNNEKDSVLTEQVATRWYRAPQVLLGSNDYGKSADIWSAGCILAQILVGKPVFPGNSTLNQLQKLLTFTGKPKASDVASLNATNAVAMINQVNIKQKSLREWFKPDVPNQAINLVVSMLSINPKNRPTANQILKHPYLASFHKPRQELSANKAIKPPISDSTKLNVKEYRKLIYERVNKLYSTGAIQDIQGLQKRNSLERSSKGNMHSVHKDQRSNSNKSKVICQQKQHKSPLAKVEKYEPIAHKYERPNSQNQKAVINKTNEVGYGHSNSFYRQTKTNNSNYSSTSSTNVQPKAVNMNTRYTSSSGHKKTSNSVSSKTGPVSHSIQNHQQPDELTPTSKKNSLKQILKAKRQNSHDNGQGYGNNYSSTAKGNFFQSHSPNIPATTTSHQNQNQNSKTQTGFYSYNPSQMIMSSPSVNQIKGNGNSMTHNYQNQVNANGRTSPYEVRPSSNPTGQSQSRHSGQSYHQQHYQSPHQGHQSIERKASNSLLGSGSQGVSKMPVQYHQYQNGHSSNYQQKQNRYC